LLVSISLLFMRKSDLLASISLLLVSKRDLLVSISLLLVSKRDFLVADEPASFSDDLFTLPRTPARLGGIGPLLIQGNTAAFADPELVPTHTTPNGEAVTDYDYGHDHNGQGDPHAHDWGVDSNGKPVRGPARAPKPGEKVPPKTGPSPAPAPIPMSDPTFMDKMSKITGLTGTALIIYLIISEGSRLFPPRNLVPVY